MPIYLAPFTFVLGAALIVWGVRRPASEFADDRRRGWSQPGWPVGNAIGALPVPLARSTWVFLGLLVIAGSVLAVV
jgi:hypothetical protein